MEMISGKGVVQCLLDGATESKPANWRCENLHGWPGSPDQCEAGEVVVAYESLVVYCAH